MFAILKNKLTSARYNSKQCKLSIPLTDFISRPAVPEEEEEKTYTLNASR